MGGKVWSDPEEMIFWLILAPNFPPGLDQDSRDVKKGRSDTLKSWERAPEMMEQEWGRRFPGVPLRRIYTAVSTYEHLFQNFHQGKLSPNAGPYVKAYKAWLKKKAENPESGSDNEESESRELSTVSESSEPSVPESSKAKESEPSETAVSIPTSATSQQGAGQQIACAAPPPPNYRPATAQLEKEYEERWPSKRPRIMANGRHDTEMSAHGVFQNQNDVLGHLNVNSGGQSVGVPPAHMGIQNSNHMAVQQTTSGNGQSVGVTDIPNMVHMAIQKEISRYGQSFGVPPVHTVFQNHNGGQPCSNSHSGFPAEQNPIGHGQLRQLMPNMQGPPHNNWGQSNRGASYPGLITGDHGAQNNANLFTDHHAAQINYSGVTGPGPVQNNTNPLMDHAAAQPNHSTITGPGGAQKRKRSD